MDNIQDPYGNNNLDYADFLRTPPRDVPMDTLQDDPPPAGVEEELDSDLEGHPFDDDVPMTDNAHGNVNNASAPTPEDEANVADLDNEVTPLTESFVKTVSAMAQGRQLSLTLDGQDAVESFGPVFQNYQFWVDKTIASTGAKKDHQLEYIALSFLNPTAERQVLIALGNDVSYSKIMKYLENVVRGLGHGPVQITIRILRYDILEAGVFSANKHNGVIPDVSYELGNFQKLLSQRGPMDDVTHCAVILNAFRRVPSILEKVKRITVDGVTVEQTNPDNLKAEIIARDSDYKAAVAQALKGKQPLIPGNKRPLNEEGPSNYHQQQQQSKAKKYTAPKGRQNQQASPFGENYNPFLDSRAKRSFQPIDRNSKCWVKGLDSQERTARKAAGKCYICNQPMDREPKHRVPTCPKSQSLFDRREMCWYNK